MITRITALLLLTSASLTALADQPPPAADVVTEPATDVIVTVLNKPILRSDLVEAATEIVRKQKSAEEFAKWQANSRMKLLSMAIRQPLLRAYAEREGLMPTDAEREQMVERFFRARQAEDDDPSSEELHRKAEASFVEAMLIEWKTARTLWEKHGGTLGAGSLGSCIPFEAQFAFLKQEVKAGRLNFHDAEIEKDFWKYAMNKQQNADVVLKDEQRIRDFFAQQFALWTEKAPTEE